METEQEPLDLASAARELGVHYQTAYRWVRTGSLPAFLVEGRYAVARSDLEALRRARSTPTRPRAPGPAPVAASAERLHAALVGGDEPQVRTIARSLVERGVTLRELVTMSLAPALSRIGQEWRDGTLAIGTEHRASAIVERLLGELAPNPRGRRRGTAVVVAIEGDRHTLPTTMAAVALREDHWTVHHLGADMPVAEIRTFCRSEPTDLVVITVTEPSVHRAAEDAASSLRELGVPVLVGGPGRTLDELLASARTAGRGPASTPARPPEEALRAR